MVLRHLLLHLLRHLLLQRLFVVLRGDLRQLHADFVKSLRQDHLAVLVLLVELPQSFYDLSVYLTKYVGHVNGFLLLLSLQLIFLPLELHDVHAQYLPQHLLNDHFIEFTALFLRVSSRLRIHILTNWIWAEELVDVQSL